MILGYEKYIVKLLEFSISFNLIMIHLGKSLVRATNTYKTAFRFSSVKLNQPEETAADAIDNSFGLNQFMRKTYLYTGGSVVASLASANLVNTYFAGSTGFAMGGAIAGLVALVATSFMKPTYV